MARARKPVSLATKAKIAASLRGNKNAYRGGPRAKLTARQKVVNINARTKAKKANFSDAQLKQRAAVAKRLRARARAEEAGIKPDHSKPIPSPNTIAKRDVEVKENDALAKKSIPKLETRSQTGLTKSQRKGAKADQARIESKVAVAKRANRTPASKDKDPRVGKPTALANSKIARDRQSAAEIAARQKAGRARLVKADVTAHRRAKQMGMSATSAKPLPKVGSSPAAKPGAALKEFMGRQPMIVQQKALDVIRAFGREHNLSAEQE